MNRKTEQHWSVEVKIDGESIVLIESNCLSGKTEITESEENIIRLAAAHLTAFAPFTYPESAHGWPPEDGLTDYQRQGW